MSSLGGKKLKEDQWIYGPEPSKGDLKRLMSCALMIVIRFMFETHTYEFNGKLYIQEDGGPIGLRFTHCIARIRMNHWVRSVRRILEDSKVQIRLLKKYVDDVRFLMARISRGLRFIPEVGLLVYDPGFEEEHSGLSDLEYTSLVLLQIMNSVANDLTFTVENQEQYGNKYMPTLDFQLRLEDKPDGSRMLRYKFFKKPMASKIGILQTSAMPENTKRNTII